MSKNLEEQKWEEAKRADSFISLLAYPRLLYHWQLSHSKDMITIGKIAGHRHGLFCKLRCRNITNAHPIPHSSCEDKCKIIDTWLKENLRLQLLSSLKQQIQEKSKHMIPFGTSE